LSAHASPNLADRRVRKTREALYAAFAALIVEQGYDAMTVQDVLDAADIGRSTFYAHFSGKEALLRFGFERFRADLSVDLAAGDRLALIASIVQHVRAHAGLYRALVGGSAGAIVREALHALIRDAVRDELGRQPEPDLDLELTAAFIAGGLVAAIERWLADGFHPAPDVLAGQLAALLARLAPPAS
jgi:AcrR family transcriptional regulator